MPYYDYRCNDCHRKVTLFYKTYAAYDAATHTCPRCGGANLTRLISRVAIARSEEARFSALEEDAALADLDENDPVALGRLMRKMSREVGEELPDEFDEVVGRLDPGRHYHPNSPWGDRDGYHNGTASGDSHAASHRHAAPARTASTAMAMTPPDTPRGMAEDRPCKRGARQGAGRPAQAASQAPPAFSALWNDDGDTVFAKQR